MTILFFLICNNSVYKWSGVNKQKGPYIRRKQDFSLIFINKARLRMKFLNEKIFYGLLISMCLILSYTVNYWFLFIKSETFRFYHKKYYIFERFDLLKKQKFIEDLHSILYYWINWHNVFLIDLLEKCVTFRFFKWEIESSNWFDKTAFLKIILY